MDRKESDKKYYTKHKESIKLKHKNYSNTKFGRASKLLGGYKFTDKLYNRGEGNLTTQWIVDNIFSKPCAHCGETDWTKIGCNRLDNSKPHTMDNVEPCCLDCNKKLAGKEKQVTLAKKVYQYTLNDCLVKVWNSLVEIKRSLGFDISHISACCRNDKYRKTYKKYKWSYKPL